MGLRYKDNAAESIAVDLYAFFEPHGTTDQHFDEYCGWIRGTTRELLDKIRLPSHAEMVEICLRLNHSLSLYVCCTAQDGSDAYGHPADFHCSAATPCCDRRQQEADSSMPGGPIDCPRRCLCHT